MSATNKLRNKLQRVSGRAKESIGRATGDRKLESRGVGDQMTGDRKLESRGVGDQFKADVKDIGEKVKDAFRGRRRGRRV